MERWTIDDGIDLFEVLEQAGLDPTRCIDALVERRIRRDDATAFVGFGLAETMYPDSGEKNHLPDVLWSKLRRTASGL